MHDKKSYEKFSVNAFAPKPKNVFKFNHFYSKLCHLLVKNNLKFIIRSFIISDEGCLVQSQRGFLLHKSFDTIDHVLDELLLRLTESSLVGDIEDSIIGLSMLTVSTSDLDLVLVGDSVEGILITHQLWQIDVNGCSHGGTKVGWARSDVTKMRVVREFNNRFNMGCGSAESIEDSCDVSTWLHRNNSELILLIDPDKESLVVVVENTSARWPVSVKTARFEEFVTFPIK